jgi:hypothetical protein
MSRVQVLMSASASNIALTSLLVRPDSIAACSRGRRD